jgi:hypothetical protein
MSAGGRRAAEAERRATDAEAAAKRYAADLETQSKLATEGAQRAAFRTLAKVHRKVGFVERPR